MKEKELQLATISEEVRSREADLSRLKEQIMLQEQMETQARPGQRSIPPPTHCTIHLHVHVSLSYCRDPSLSNCRELGTQARKLKEAHDAQHAGGVYLSWRAVGSLALVGLGASAYLASKIGSPTRKGYEQIFVPKDH